MIPQNSVWMLRWKLKMLNVDSNIPENRLEEVDDEVKIEVKDEDGDEEMLIIFANSVELYFQVKLL